MQHLTNGKQCGKAFTPNSFKLLYNYRVLKNSRVFVFRVFTGACDRQKKSGASGLSLLIVHFFTSLRFLVVHFHSSFEVYFFCFFFLVSLRSLVFSAPLDALSTIGR